MSADALASPGSRDPERRIAVTGGTGFIGRHVIRALRERGFTVRALAHRPAPEMPADVEMVLGSLEDSASLAALVRDVCAVVHCAGAVRATNASRFRAVNAFGTGRLVTAVDQHGEAGPRVILVSSLAAREPALSPYAASKREAESILVESGLEHCIVRPPAVYGPGDRATLPLFRLLTKPLATIPGSARSHFSLIFVEDLARLIADIVARPHWHGAILEPDDGQPCGYSWKDLTEIAEQALGISVRLVLLPKWLLRAPAAIGEAAAALAGRAPALTTGKLNELYFADWVCRPGVPRLLQDWRARTRFSHGFPLTVGWYVREGWITPPRRPH